MKYIALGLCSLFVAGSISVFADAGDPIFPQDLDDKTRAEIIYQGWKRDLDTGGEIDADIYLLRLHTDVGQYAYLDFDLGGLDLSEGELSFYGGLGLRYLAYDGDTWRVSPYAQGHYSPDPSTKDTEYDSLIDAEAGVLFAFKLQMTDDLMLMPYVGPALSIVRLSGDEDAEEDNLLGGVAGASLEMPGHNSIRLELQIFDQLSVSAAAGIAF